MQKVLVVGSGGLAREFASFFSEQVEIVGFSSKSEKEFNDFNLPGQYFDVDVSPDEAGTDKCVIAIGSPGGKQKIGGELKEKGFSFPNLVHESTIAQVDWPGDTEGVIISPNCTIGSNVRFGSHVYINFMVGVGHDAIFHDFIQVNPGVQIGGFAAIQSKVLIGSGATIREKLTVGEGSTVGSGSVVLANVRPNITVLGNPARKLKLASFK